MLFHYSKKVFELVFSSTRFFDAAAVVVDDDELQYRLALFLTSMTCQTDKWVDYIWPDNTGYTGTSSGFWAASSLLSSRQIPLE